MQTETDVQWSATREGDLSLVAVVLWSGRPRRVRVRPTVEGAVWPPREAGVPAEGWDGDEFEGTVDGRRAVGFATPGDGAVEESDDAPPVAVTWLGPVESEATFDRHPDLPAVVATTAGVVRALGDPTPPRDAVPDGPTAVASGSEPPEQSAARPVRATDSPEGADPDGSRASDSLAALERRVELGEALDAADSLRAATEAVERAGGLNAVRALRADLRRDAERPRGRGARAETLRERAERVSVPVETLERLA